MFHGKMKALTFSYDDGVTQDRRLVELFDRYGLKATFNINSELLGKPGTLWRENMWVDHNKIRPEEVGELYRNHEVAVHTLTHPHLTELEEPEIIRQVEEDRINLERLTGKAVVGMAYPGGGINNDERVAAVIRDHTAMKYARTITSCGHFDVQQDLHRFQPSVYHIEFDRMTELGESFLKLQPDTPQIYYIWGHSYELDYHDTWGKFEEFCRMMSGRDDIFYGTNCEVLLSDVTDSLYHA